MKTGSDWTLYRTRFLVRARQLTESVKFTDALGREHCGQPGDYMVEIFDGLLCITPRKFFEDIYVRLESHSGNFDSDDSKSQALLDHGTKTSDLPKRISPAGLNDRGSTLERNSSLMVPSAPERSHRSSLIA
jgi:hypothetical protein